MAFNTFDVTEVTYNFTATVTTPIELTLTGTDTHLTVVSATTASISVINTRAPISISDGSVGGGSSYNQTLNTTDSVLFNSLTTPSIYGYAGAPVSFPTGINATNFGTVFSGALDFGSFQESAATNLLSLFFLSLPINMGTIFIQPAFSVDMGPITS
jgi:hypothetical protein